MEEICQKWGSDPVRRNILSGLLRLRQDLLAVGLQNGFQWLDGSFVEDCESRNSRSPGDVDVITFFHPYILNPQAPTNLVATLGNSVLTKGQYQVHHMYVPLLLPPDQLVNHTHFWYGLFTHTKSDNVRKGILRVELNSPPEDAAATAHLASF